MSYLLRSCLALALLIAPAPAELTPSVAVAATRAGTCTVEFLDIDQGDSILITSPEGKRALVEDGPKKDVAATLLKDRGIDSLDLLVLSHHHSDHYGGMSEVVKLCHPKVFIDSGSDLATPMYLSFLQLIKDEGITNIRSQDTSRKLNLGSVVITVLPHPADEENNNVGLRVQFGDVAALMTGDSEEPAREFWLGNVAARALVAKGPAEVRPRVTAQ